MSNALTCALLNREDDLERLARRKQADMEKKVASLQEHVDLKTQR